MKHFATIAGGEPRMLEDMIEAAVMERRGVLNVHEIGGTAQWEERPDVPWSLEWLRLVSPRGLRLDVYVPDGYPADAIGEELWQGIFQGRALPIVPGAPEVPESLPGTTGGGGSTGGGSTGGGSTGGGIVGTIGGIGSRIGDALPAIGAGVGAAREVSEARTGIKIATVAGAIGTATTGALLWRCRKKKACKRRPFVVGALVVSALVTVGGGAVWLLTRKGEA